MRDVSLDRATTVARYAVGLALLGWVLTTVEWGRTASILRRLGPFSASAVVAVSVTNVGPWALMWQSLVSDRSGADLLNLLRADLTVKFVNGLLPSRLAGRTVAPVALRQFAGVSGADAVAIAALHTGLYALCYALVCLVGLVTVASRVSGGVLLLIGLSTAGYAVAGVVIVLGGLRADRLAPALVPVSRAVRMLPLVGDRVARAILGATESIGGSTDTFRSLLSDPTRVLGFVVAWTTGVVVLPGLRFWLLLEVLTAGHVSLLSVPVYLVTAYSVTLLPLTPGGIGVTEATSTLVFVSLGFPEAAVIPAIFLDRIVGVYLPSLVGWVPATQMRIGLDDVGEQ